MIYLLLSPAEHWDRRLYHRDISYGLARAVNCVGYSPWLQSGPVNPGQQSLTDVMTVLISILYSGR